MRIRKKYIIWVILALPLLFASCRGGGLVFKGFHRDQDQALLERLAEKYPSMSFCCTGQVEGSRHTIEAGDGTTFTVWTAPGSKGSFQVIDYYLEEWLAGQGFYSDLENELREMGFEWEYTSYNYYDRHFEYQFGALDDPERLLQAVEVLDYTKECFDHLYEKFVESAGSGKSPLFYLTAGFTVKGKEHFLHAQIAPPTGVWSFEYDYDDYARYFDRYLQEDGDSTIIE